MSLELVIQENTAALLSLQAMLAGLTVTASAAQGPKSAPVAAESAHGPATAKAAAPIKTASAPTPAAASVATDAPASTAATLDPKPAAVSQPSETAAAQLASNPEASKPVPPTATAVTYDDVKALVLQVSKDKGRDTAAAVLAGFGVAKAPELKPAQYADAVAQLKAALA
jgi:hypothetical protein